MIIVGLTGGIGSGKSTIALLFEVLGIPIFESDKEAKLAMQSPEVVEAIRKEFGREVFDASGVLNRKLLADIVFSNKSKLNALNGIVHPAVRTRFEAWKDRWDEQQVPYVINEAAILFESGLNKQMDFTITVSAAESIRIKRVALRDGASFADVQARMDNQLNDIQRESIADAVIVNDGIMAVIPQVLHLHNLLLNKIRR